MVSSTNSSKKNSNDELRSWASGMEDLIARDLLVFYCMLQLVQLVHLVREYWLFKLATITNSLSILLAFAFNISCTSYGTCSNH